MSMPIHSLHANELNSLLSAGRLAKLLSLTNSLETAIEFHQESLKIGFHLMGPIGTIEIALRNSVVANLDSYRGSTGWLYGNFQLIRGTKELRLLRKAADNARRTKYANLNPEQRAAAGGWQNLQVTDDEIITALSFNFWKSLYGPEYERTLWRLTLRRTFPYKPLDRSDVASQLEVLYQTRNRLAHHEPVQGQRFLDTIKAIRFISQHLGANMPSHDTALATLLEEDINQICAIEHNYRNRLDAYRT